MGIHYTAEFYTNDLITHIYSIKSPTKTENKTQRGEVTGPKSQLVSGIIQIRIQAVLCPDSMPCSNPWSGDLVTRL